MNNLIRPSLKHSAYEIVPVINNNQQKETVDVVGPICESDDFLRNDYKLAHVNTGDFLATTNTGAYVQALSSNYNLRPTIEEYIVNGSNNSCIFKGSSIEKIASGYEC